VLRHDPACIGLVLDAKGWVDVADLVRRANAHGRDLTRAELVEIVRTNDKQRFSLSDDGARIRARQGHSVDVDLGLEPVEPPEFLYHGTATRFLGSILAEGLRPGSRRHVHLSPDHDTAIRVGRRHGTPIVLKIRSKKMHEGGAVFLLSENGVWLTDLVPPGFIEFEEEVGA